MAPNHISPSVVRHHYRLKLEEGQGGEPRALVSRLLPARVGLLPAGGGGGVGESLRSFNLGFCGKAFFEIWFHFGGGGCQFLEGTIHFIRKRMSVAGMIRSSLIAGLDWGGEGRWENKQSQQMSRGFVLPVAIFCQGDLLSNEMDVVGISERVVCQCGHRRPTLVSHTAVLLLVQPRSGRNLGAVFLFVCSREARD